MQAIPGEGATGTREEIVVSDFERERLRDFLPVVTLSHLVMMPSQIQALRSVCPLLWTAECVMPIRSARARKIEAELESDVAVLGPLCV